MGRAVHYRVHALTGLASAKRNTEDESCLTFARSLIPRPVQAAKAYSARDSDHDDMRKLRWHARVDKRAHRPALPEEFERRRLVQLTGKDSSWVKRWQRCSPTDAINSHRKIVSRLRASVFRT